MKKLLLLAAFSGLLASSAVAGTYGDDKGKSKECKKEGKSCAGEKKDGCSKEGKSCCKGKAKADASTDKGTSEKK